MTSGSADGGRWRSSPICRTQSSASTPIPTPRSRPSSLPEDIQEALRSLPPDFRAPLVLCDVVGLDYAEIASVAGDPAGHRPQPHPPGPGPAAEGACRHDRAPRLRASAPTPTASWRLRSEPGSSRTSAPARRAGTSWRRPARPRLGSRRCPRSCPRSASTSGCCSIRQARRRAPTGGRCGSARSASPPWRRSGWRSSGLAGSVGDGASGMPALNSLVSPARGHRPRPARAVVSDEAQHQAASLGLPGEIGTFDLTGLVDHGLEQQATYTDGDQTHVGVRAAPLRHRGVAAAGRPPAVWFGDQVVWLRAPGGRAR